MKHGVSGVVVGVMAHLSIAQVEADTTALSKDTLQYERFIEVIENALAEHYAETWGEENSQDVIEAKGYAPDDRPVFSDTVYIERLQALNQTTPIEIIPHPDILKVVRYFASQRRHFTAVCLGRSKLFFPLYETYLDKYNMPLELKYLSVIESGLRPTVKSRVGATGLWQFMYRTGKMFGLDTDSYIDERMDPERATDAACRYLSYLHKLYGDWCLALAAYNAGPGNVNKAIRRSGGQTNYWLLRPYLPKETQMYVPNFIAMIYMMNHYADHNIVPVPPKVYRHEVDTVCLQAGIRISHIDSLLALSEDDFRYLNPIYKTDVIPASEQPQCISLPCEKISLFFEREESLYHYQREMDSLQLVQLAAQPESRVHYVRRRETLSQIAQQYNVTVSAIKERNDLRSNTIHPGQRLTIEATGGKSTAKKRTTPVRSTSSSKVKYKYYTLARGETFWRVSRKLGIPLAQIQSLNKHLNPKRLKEGAKIRIQRI